jgi:hypothetical protein
MDHVQYWTWGSELDACRFGAVCHWLEWGERMLRAHIIMVGSAIVYNASWNPISLYWYCDEAGVVQSNNGYAHAPIAYLDIQ